MVPNIIMAGCARGTGAGANTFTPGPISAGLYSCHSGVVVVVVAGGGRREGDGGRRLDAPKRQFY